MDFVDRLRQLADKAQVVRQQLLTEEAAKNALVMPFINLLGYDVFNPTEVIPEFISDVGIKKGEKVDYAIVKDGKIIILIECKPINADLDKLTCSQLYRYFSVTDAKFAIFTNGVRYQIYTDLDSTNRMDQRPFLDFDITEFRADIIEEIKKFTKDAFDVSSILSTAEDLKYKKGILRILDEEWAAPSEEFLKLMIGRIYDGVKTQAVRDKFVIILKKALQEFVSEKVNNRLKSALQQDSFAAFDVQEPAPAAVEEKVVTSEEELQGYYIVKSICGAVVDVHRIAIRDMQSYCGVLLDDNNRKPICRLFFNGSAKYIGLLDRDKKVTRHRINSINDIYSHAEQIRMTVTRYEKNEMNLDAVEQTEPVAS